ncbi:Annexin D5 [Linum perenne]
MIIMSTLTVPSPQPSPREDASQLHRAFKGLVCDTAVVVNILAHRDPTQRENILQEYETLYSHDLRKVLADELHGNLKKAVVLWMENPTERDSIALRQAFKAVPLFDARGATEIICTRTCSQIRHIKQAYSSKFGSSLEDDIKNYASGDHKRLLLAYINTTRYEGPEIDKLLVESDANCIRKMKSGNASDEAALIEIFTERSRAHLVALQSAYETMYKKDLRMAIKEVTSGSFRNGLSAILQCAENPAKYYAKVFRKAMRGLGTHDSALIRAVVTRTEIDMQDIKVEYQKRFKKQLVDVIHSETSGHYRNFLIALISG